MSKQIALSFQLPGIVALISMLIMIVVPAAHAGAASIKVKHSTPLDLAAMALTPSDLEQAGYAGFGVASVDADSSGWRTLGDAAADSIAGNYMFNQNTPEPLNVGLAQDGWQRQYRRVLAQPDPLDPTSVNLSVRSEIAVYTDAAGADDALTLLMNGGSTESPGDLPVGDRLEIRTDLNPNTGARLVVAFREGNLIGSVEVVQYASAVDPEIDPAVLLARQLKARIDAQLNPQAPGLADAAIRLSTLAAPAEYEGYMRHGGESFISWGESQDDFATRDATYGKAVDVYQLEQTVAPTSDEVVPPYYINRLYRFPDETSARDLINQVPDLLASNAANSGGKFDAARVDNSTAFGDASLTYQIKDELHAGTTFGYRIYVQVGTDVARLQLDSSNQPSLQNAEALAAAETACLEAGSCAAAEQSSVSLPGLDCPPTHEADQITDYPYSDFAPSPMFGVDAARSGAQPGPAVSGDPLGIWSVDVHGGLATSPVVSDGLLIFGSSETITSDASDPLARQSESDYLFAFDPKSGFKWCAPTGNAIAEPTIDNGLVFTETDPIAGQHQQTSVVALDAESGLARWQFPIGWSVSGYDAAVTASNGTVYITTGMGAVFALDEATGTPLWLHQIGQDVDMSPLDMSYPAIDGNAVYVSGGSVLYALNADTGDELWSIQADDESEVFGTPSIANGIVYVGGQSAIYAVDAKTGDEKWVTDEASPGGTKLAVVDGVVYAGGGSETDPTIHGFVAAIAADTGTEIWHVDLKGYATTPVVACDVVYVGAGATQEDGTVAGGILGFSTADGSVLVNTLISGAVTSPVVTGGAIYIGSSATTDNGQQGTLNVIGGETAPSNGTPILDQKSG